MPSHEGGLGYMASMFHLFTHAMFKALLFLGAGCIIHAVHNNEMSVMGGLRKYMPVTHVTFLIACLAIVFRFLFQGRDSDGLLCFQSGDGLCHDFHCRDDGFLHVPSVLLYFLGA